MFLLPRVVLTSGQISSAVSHNHLNQVLFDSNTWIHYYENQQYLINFFFIKRNKVNATELLIEQDWEKSTVYLSVMHTKLFYKYQHV